LQTKANNEMRVLTKNEKGWEGFNNGEGNLTGGKSVHTTSSIQVFQYSGLEKENKEKRSVRDPKNWGMGVSLRVHVIVR